MGIVPEKNIHEIVRRYAPMVLRLAYAHTRSRADAEDICQEVMLRLFRQQREFQSEEHIRFWLVRSTINACSNLFRSAWRRLVRVTELVPEEASEEPVETPLGEALDRLPGRYRTVLHLFYYEDMPVKEIAQALGMKPSAVRTRLTRARRLLRAELEPGKEAEHVQG